MKTSGRVTVVSAATVRVARVLGELKVVLATFDNLIAPFNFFLTADYLYDLIVGARKMEIIGEQLDMRLLWWLLQLVVRPEYR